MIDEALYQLRRVSWYGRPDLYRWGRARGRPIRRPVFVVGLQGGGLTLITRILRRHRSLVSVSGGPDYWTGADEMHVVLGRHLPDDLSLLPTDSSLHPDFGRHVGWSYASDALLSRYRRTGLDALGARGGRARAALRSAIQASVLRFGEAEDSRFIDKSQSYAVKIPYLRALLEGADPRFVAVSRNPFAACWRAVTVSDLRHGPLSVAAKARVAAEHWNNSMSLVLAEANHEDVQVLRIEDILRDLEHAMGAICEHVGLELSDHMLPQEGQELPRGTKRTERWWPVRRDINSKYLDALPAEVRKVITEVCGETMTVLGYQCDGA